MNLDGVGWLQLYRVGAIEVVHDQHLDGTGHDWFRAGPRKFLVSTFMWEELKKLPKGTSPGAAG